MVRDEGGVADIYRGHSHEHDDELFLAQHGVADERVDESGETPATFLDEGGVGCDMVAVYCLTLAMPFRKILEKLKLLKGTHSRLASVAAEAVA